VRIEGARRHEGAPGAPLSPGWGVVTIGPDSNALLAFPDGTTLALGADTALLQISESSDHGRGKEAFLARGKVTADVRPQVWPMKLSTPEAAATVVGTRFSLTVDRASTRLDVEHGGVEIAPLGGGAPATVRASQYAVVTSASQAISVRTRGVALLLVGERALQYDDERVKQRLEGLGFSVRVRGAGPPDAQELRDTEVILVSSSVFSLDLNTQYRDVAVPVLVWEPSLFDDFGMTGPEENQGCGVAFGTGEAQIKLPGHPMAAGLDGTVTVVSNGKNLHHIWMAYGTPGPAAAWVATWPGLPNRAVLFAYERGAAMPGLPAAPARRVGFFFYDDGRLHLTAAGWTLFDAAVSWAAGR
jgi:transposase